MAEHRVGPLLLLGAGVLAVVLIASAMDRDEDEDGGDGGVPGGDPFLTMIEDVNLMVRSRR